MFIVKVYAPAKAFVHFSLKIQLRNLAYLLPKVVVIWLYIYKHIPYIDKDCIMYWKNFDPWFNASTHDDSVYIYILYVYDICETLAKVVGYLAWIDDAYLLSLFHIQDGINLKYSWIFLYIHTLTYKYIVIPCWELSTNKINPNTHVSHWNGNSIYTNTSMLRIGWKSVLSLHSLAATTAI